MKQYSSFFCYQISSINLHFRFHLRTKCLRHDQKVRIVSFLLYLNNVLRKLFIWLAELMEEICIETIVSFQFLVWMIRSKHHFMNGNGIVQSHTGWGNRVHFWKYTQFQRGNSIRHSIWVDMEKWRKYFVWHNHSASDTEF